MVYQGVKSGWTNQTFLIVKPGLPDFNICAKSLVNQGIPGKTGYYKNQENQTLTRLLNFQWTRLTRLEPHVQKAWLL